MLLPLLLVCLPLACFDKGTDEDDDDGGGGGGGWDLGSDTGLSSDGGSSEGGSGDGGSSDGGSGDGGSGDGGSSDGGSGDGGSSDGGSSDGGSSDGGAEVGWLELETDFVDFGEVSTTSAATETVEIANESSTEVRITRLSSSDSAFVLQGVTAPSTVSPGSVVDLRIRFEPGAEAVFEAEVEVQTDVGPYLIEVVGEGVCTSSSCEPDIEVRSGTTAVTELSMFSLLGISDSVSLTVRNDGGADLDLDDVHLTNDPAGGTFALSGWSGAATIAPGSSTTVTVSYSCPTAASPCIDSPDTGRDYNILHLESNDPDTPDWTVALSGTGV